MGESARSCKATITFEVSDVPESATSPLEMCLAALQKRLIEPYRQPNSGEAQILRPKILAIEVVQE